MLKVLSLNKTNFSAAPPAQPARKVSDTSNPADKNPVSKTGERLKLAKAAFLAGLGFGVKMLAEIFDSEFTLEHLEKQGRKIANKNYKNASKHKREWMTVLSTLGLAGIFVGGCAFLYTLFKTPKIMYEGKVNAFTKGRDMDIYIKGNTIEKNLLTQMNDKAKNADDGEKQKLKEQYMKMQMAKNQLPAFMK